MTDDVQTAPGGVVAEPEERPSGPDVDVSGDRTPVGGQGCPGTQLQETLKIAQGLA